VLFALALCWAPVGLMGSGHFESGDPAAGDQYGGLTALKSPSGKTGGWSVEKYPTPDGNGRWLITTPSGHGLWCGMQFAVAAPTKLNVNAKYGSVANWQKAVLARYAGWGFNCLAEYADSGLLMAMNHGALGKQLPYFGSDHFVMDAIYRRKMLPGQQLPNDAVKDLAYTAAKITNYTAQVADAFDPNLAPYVANFAAARIKSPGDAYAQALMSRWNIGVSIDDSDYTYGFGPGPDDCPTPDRTYHSHIGWMALASPPNLYAMWHDAANVYDAWNWIFTDTNVHAKNNLVDFLKSRYQGNISLLNAAWGSHYTGFATDATRYTGELVGVTDGAVAEIRHTLMHDRISPASLLVKVDGAPLATDPPRNPGRLVGRWPDGITRLGGTIDFHTGALTLSVTAYNQFNKSAPGTPSWGTINLGHGNIIPGSIILRLRPPDCRITDDAGAKNAWQPYNLCGVSYTIAGTVDYAAGTIGSLTITPPISSNNEVQFQFRWTQALPGKHTITIDYDVNGFGVGNTLADEDGSHTEWLGNTEGLLRKSEVPLAVWNDLNAWLADYSDHYYANTIDVLRPYFPGKLITAQMSGLGGHHGCPRKEMAVAAAAHSDILLFSQIEQPLLDRLVAWGLGDKPVMDAWEGMVAQPDSPFSAFASNWHDSVDGFRTQPDRGSAMAAKINQALTARGKGGTSYQILGIKFWAYSDTTSEHSNFGLTSPLDNSYDGLESTTPMHPCSAPLQSYKCGGEAANYGDALTPVKGALTSWPAAIFQSAPPSPPTQPQR
jgi:hypothetical protein